METVSKKHKFFNNMANPVLRSMAKNAECFADNCATYGGITGKTLFFLLMSVAGVVASFILHNFFINSAGGDVHHFVDQERGIYDLTITTAEAGVVGVIALISLIVPFLAWFVKRTIPVTGTIYCIAQGILLGYITIALAQEYRYLSLLAMIITVVLVGILLLMYAKGVIKVTAKFKGVIFTIFLGIIISGGVYFLLSLIPAIRNSAMFSNLVRITNMPAISIALSVIFIILASLFMLADFNTIQTCVENRVAKRYEWMAAWGLAYTVLYIYFKVLRVLLSIAESGKGSKS